MDVIVIGGLNTDYLGRGPALPQSGETKNGDIFFTGPGGKGANQAVACARLGARVALVGAVGDDDRGQVLIDDARREGVNVDCIRRINGMQTGVAMIHVDEHAEKQILAVPGANRGLTVDDVERALAKLTDIRPGSPRRESEGGSGLVVLAQLEVPLECVEAAFRWARAHGARTVLDPAPAIRLSGDFLALVDVLKPNAGEAEVLTGVRVVHRDAGRKAARKLLHAGVGAAVIQAGRGNLVVWPEGEHWLQKIKVDAVDATGAGDALAGTLATYLARGRTLIEAATYANAAAALQTTKLGAQTGLPREEEILALLNS